MPTTLDIYIRNRDTVYEVDFGRMTYKVFKGTPQNPSEVLYSGSIKFITSDKVSIKNDPTLKNAPLIVVRNPYAGKKNFILWVDHNKVDYECSSGYYNLSVVKDAVPFLDFIIFFEDKWGEKNPDYDYNEHVTRVVWTKEGYAIVMVYFGAHGYTFDVYVGGKYVYTVGGGNKKETCCGKCVYCNIVTCNYNGTHGVDDLRSYIPDKVYKVVP